MKLQHLTVIFIIIILPIILILSYYIQTQITTATLRDNYKTALINSTHDAMTAYELNSMNNDYNEDANSKKRDVQASINTFFTSLANNLGVPGYVDEYIEPYIPAIVFTSYDGYYIYARTPETPRYTKEEQDAGEGEEGDIKEGEADEYDYNLKPYIYYSAQYQSGDIDVVINYTLDNYITVYGTINGTYYAKSGYLLPNVNSLTGLTNENLSETITCKIKLGSGNSAKDVYFEKKDCPYFYTYNFQSNSFEKVYYITDSFNIIDPDDINLKHSSNIYGDNELGDINVIGPDYLKDNTLYFKIAAGYFSQVDGNQITIDEATAKSDNNKVYRIENIVQWYKNSNILSDSKIKDALTSLKVNDMLVINSEGNKVKAATLNDETDSTNAYYKFKNNSNYIFAINTSNQFTYFDNHRQDVIKASIQENLKSALANYQSGTYTYKLPMLTDTDWDKIFSNISMIAFMQDLPVKYTTLNDYVIATSTGNKEYVPDDGIYFIDKNTNTYHRITCSHLKAAKDEGHSIIGYKAMEFERNNTKIDGKEPLYYYPHEVTACYDCIVSSDYSSLYEQNGNITVTDPDLLKIYYTALARERVTQYKATKYLTSWW